MEIIKSKKLKQIGGNGAGIIIKVICLESMSIPKHAIKDPFSYTHARLMMARF